MTTEQRADIRARIAQRLAQSPSLLVLDNCEHLVEAAAELTAFLVSASPDLRVLTESRTPSTDPTSTATSSAAVTPASSTKWTTG